MALLGERGSAFHENLSWGSPSARTAAAHGLLDQKTRGVVNAGISTLANLAYQDIARAIQAAKSVIRRYRGKSGPGMAVCRLSAKTFIFDVHIHSVNAEADEFAASVTNDVPSNAILSHNSLRVIQAIC
jgi:hypothetical protein